MRLTIAAFFMLLVFQGCGLDFIFEKKITIPADTWTQDNKLEFTFDIDNPKALYNLYLDINHSIDFKSQNMYVKFYTKSPSQKILADQVSLEMAGKGGVWFGDCGEEWCDLRIPIQQKAYFDEVGQWSLTIEQFTRTENLEGIKSIGLNIEDTKEERK